MWTRLSWPYSEFTAKPMFYYSDNLIISRPFNWFPFTYVSLHKDLTNHHHHHHHHKESFSNDMYSSNDIAPQQILRHNWSLNCWLLEQFEVIKIEGQTIKCPSEYRKDIRKDRKANRLSTTNKTNDNGNHKN
jgi:hypothetical protein